MRNIKSQSSPGADNADNASLSKSNLTIEALESNNTGNDVCHSGAQQSSGVGDDLVAEHEHQLGEVYRFSCENVIPDNDYERAIRLYTGILSTTPDFVYAFDRQGRFLYANRRLLEVWGRKLEDCVGKTCFELGYEKWHHDMHMREIATVITTKQPIRGEVPFEAPLTGIYGVYDYIFTPVLGPDGEVEFIAGTTRDVTERINMYKELQSKTSSLAELNAQLEVARDEALAASSAKSAFLANMSHELRTPLNAIIGYSEMLKEELSDKAPDTATGDLDKILTAGVHLLTVISDILDLSKIEAGKIDLEFQHFSVPESVSVTVGILKPLLEKNRNSVDVKGAEEEMIIFSDQTRFRQIIFNLLSNAAKFTEDGTVTVSYRRVSNPDGLDLVEVSVADTGPGMPQDQMKQLFTEYSHFGSGSNHGKTGAGLGLAISSRLCKILGGELRAETELGKGSVFTAILPLEYKLRA